MNRKRKWRIITTWGICSKKASKNVIHFVRWHSTGRDNVAVATLNIKPTTIHPTVHKSHLSSEDLLKFKRGILTQLIDDQRVKFGMCEKIVDALDKFRTRTSHLDKFDWLRQSFADNGVSSRVVTVVGKWKLEQTRKLCEKPTWRRWKNRFVAGTDHRKSCHIRKAQSFVHLEWVFMRSSCMDGQCSKIRSCFCEVRESKLFNVIRVHFSKIWKLRNRLKNDTAFATKKSRQLWKSF